ncbi:MAG: ABC transporter permease [Pseudomonadota bacterium]
MDLIVAQTLNGLANASALFLVASGLTLIFGVTRVVNFAHGSFFMLGAYLGIEIQALLTAVLPAGSAFWLAMLLAALATGLIGAVIELVILSRLYRAPELFQLVVTFGIALCIKDLALLAFGPEDRIGPRAPGLEGTVPVAGVETPAYDLVLIALMPVLLGALWWLIRRTRFGRLVRAAVEDREMVAPLGVNQRWLFTATFALGTALAGLGGALQLPRGGADLLMDLTILAPAFVVVVIGGMGSVTGAALAAVIVALANVAGVTVLPESTLVLTFVVMAAVLAIRPHGLLGRPEADHAAPPTATAERPLGPPGWGERGAVLLAIAALATLPWWGSEFAPFLAVDIIVFCLFAAALHFVVGLGGLVSFGHAAYFGGGAYAAALAVTAADAPMTLALALAPVAAGLMALTVGLFVTRLSGVYFAMLTLAFAQLVWSVAFQWTEVTGGDDGILGIWPARWADGPVAYFYLTLVLGVGGILVLRHAAHSPLGYALRAARDGERRAAASGIPVARIQAAGFAFSGLMAGLAGGLFVFSKGSVFPNELEIARSFDALIVVMLGGVGTLAGPVVGAAAFAYAEDWLTRLDTWRLWLGLAVIVTTLVMPQGIVGTLQRLFARSWPRRLPARAGRL